MGVMKDTVKTDDGHETVLYIEYDEEDSLPGMYAGPDAEDELRGIALPDAHEAFKKSMELIHTCAEQVAQTIENLSEKARPAACEVQFSIKLSAGVALLVNTSSEAQLQVTLKWGKEA